MFWYYYDGITAISERNQPLVVCGFGEDYQLVVSAEEECLVEAE